MKPAVEAAIAELEAVYPGKVRFNEDADGGAHVRVEDLVVGGAFDPERSWVAFHVTHGYPEAIVYPHFVDAALRYVGDGPAPNEHPEGNLPTAMTRGIFVILGEQQAAIQVSRSSPHRDPLSDTALKKLERVLDFLGSR